MIRYVFVIYLTIGSLWPATARAQDWTLERALEAAEKASPTTRRIDATVKAARASRLEAASRLGPAIAVSASYLRNDEEVVMTVPSAPGQTVENVITPLEQESARLSISMPLLDPQGYLSVRQAGRQLKAAVADSRDARALFRLAVAGAYLDTVVADARLTVARQTLEAEHLRLERSRSRAAVGRERESAVLRLEADVLAADQAREEATWRARSAREVLSIYVRQPVEGELAPVPLADTLPERSPESVDAHPSVQAAKARLEASSAAVAQAWASFLPRVDGSFSYQVVDPSSFTNPDGESWAAMVTGSWTLFGSGGRAAVLSRTRANLEASRAGYDETRDAVRREISRALADAAAARQAVDVAEARVRVAELAAKEAQADYEEGAALLLDLRAADVSLSQARAAVVEARARASRAFLVLERAFGRL